MSQYDTYKWMTIPKFMTKKELQNMRDKIAYDRTWGAILTGAMIGGVGFLNVPAAVLSFTVGTGIGIAASFQNGANNRIQDILDDYNCENGIHVLLKAEGRFNIAGTRLLEITYTDVYGTTLFDDVESEWI